VAGDAAGFVLVTGYLLLGINYAMLSGAAAAEALIEAAKRGDFSTQTLSVYEKLLNEKNVLSTFKKFKHTPELVNNPNVQNVYPEMICSFMESLYKVDNGPLPKLAGLARSELTKSGLSLLKVAKDLVQVGRTLG